MVFMLATLAVVAIVGCSEKLEGSANCATLCPEQTVPVRDTVLDVPPGDTSVSGFPTIGTEDFIIVGKFGDTLETRGIVRFDSLGKNFFNVTDSAVTHVDSARVLLKLIPDSTGLGASPFTINIYDVDTTAADTVTAGLLPLFREDRLIGGGVFTPAQLAQDTLSIPLIGDSLVAKIKAGARLRLGFAIRPQGNSTPVLRFSSTEGGDPPQLVYRVSADTSVPRVFVSPLSEGANIPFVAGALADFTIVAVNAFAPDPALLTVGGVPGTRAMVRFAVPSYIVDSSTIVRATLMLTQAPNRASARAADSISVSPVPVLASSVLTDPRTVFSFVGVPGSLGLQSLRVLPSDSGVRSFEIAPLVRTWKGVADSLNPRVIVLRADSELVVPGQATFFSSKAPIGVRPRLRLTFVPRSNYGLP
jgi:hypothetical protein